MKYMYWVIEFHKVTPMFFVVILQTEKPLPNIETETRPKVRGPHTTCSLYMGELLVFKSKFSDKIKTCSLRYQHLTRNAFCVLSRGGGSGSLITYWWAEAFNFN